MFAFSVFMYPSVIAYRWDSNCIFIIYNTYMPKFLFLLAYITEHCSFRYPDHWCYHKAWLDGWRNWCQRCPGEQAAAPPPWIRWGRQQVTEGWCHLQINFAYCQSYQMEMGLGIRKYIFSFCHIIISSHPPPYLIRTSRILKERKTSKQPLQPSASSSWLIHPTAMWLTEWEHPTFSAFSTNSWPITSERHCPASGTNFKSNC